jgi:hypothetical protein
MPILSFDPGDRAVEFLLVVTLGVTFLSGVAWAVSRLLSGDVALRQRILLAGLICCLALPALAGLCSASRLVLVTVP